MKVTVPAVVALLVFIVPAYATDPPDRKEGLWAVTTVQTEQPGNNKTQVTQSVCRSHDYDAYEQQLAKDTAQRSQCPITLNSQGNTATSDYHCVFSGSTISRRETTTYVSDSEVHFESRTTIAPPLGGVAQRNIVTDQKFVGPCPSDLQPGDMKSEDGKVHHLWHH